MELFREVDPMSEEAEFQPRFVVPVTIDYEAALNKLIHRDAYMASGITMQGLMAVVDAALGVEEGDDDE